MTTRLTMLATEMLTRRMHFAAPPTDPAIDIKRLPALPGGGYALPGGGYALRGVRQTGGRAAGP